jgi:hypothetical protein
MGRASGLSGENSYWSLQFSFFFLYVGGAACLLGASEEGGEVMVVVIKGGRGKTLGKAVVKKKDLSFASWHD